jgi:hypothetical protein
MIGGQPKIAEFPDETERHDTGWDGLQRFRKPLVFRFGAIGLNGSQSSVLAA